MITNAQLVVAEGKLAENIAENVILPHLETMEMQIRDLLGDVKFEAIENKTAPYTEADFERLKKAETLWALSLLVVPLNSRVKADGGFVRGVGFNETRTDLLSPMEVETIANNYYNRARDLLGKFLTAEDEEGCRFITDGLGFYAL